MRRVTSRCPPNAIGLASSLNDTAPGKFPRAAFSVQRSIGDDGPSPRRKERYGRAGDPGAAFGAAGSTEAATIGGAGFVSTPLAGGAVPEPSFVEAPRGASGTAGFVGAAGTTGAAGTLGAATGGFGGKGKAGAAAGTGAAAGAEGSAGRTAPWFSGEFGFNGFLSPSPSFKRRLNN